MQIPNIVVMGVAGCGKSSLGQLLARQLAARFIEGDSYHPPANIDRMSAGIALTDSDRTEWLTGLSQQLAEGRARGERLVLACSALKRRYRDLLRQGDPTLLFVHLAGSRALIAARMAARQQHFMPTSLLDSQFRDLEPPGPDERAIHCDVSQPPQELAQQVLDWLAQVDRPAATDSRLGTDGGAAV